jgi:hypothetical protein
LARKLAIDLIVGVPEDPELGKLRIIVLRLNKIPFPQHNLCGRSRRRADGIPTGQLGTGRPASVRLKRVG